MHQSFIPLFIALQPLGLDMKMSKGKDALQSNFIKQLKHYNLFLIGTSVAEKVPFLIEYLL